MDILLEKIEDLSEEKAQEAIKKAVKPYKKNVEIFYNIKKNIYFMESNKEFKKLVQKNIEQKR